MLLLKYILKYKERVLIAIKIKVRKLNSIFYVMEKLKWVEEEWM